MRIALFGDIHANLEALEAVLADAAEQGCDSYVCLGDVVGYNADPDDCVALLERHGVASIGGNLMQRTRCVYFYDLGTACNKREPGYCTDLITDKALAWLESGRDKSKPFVLMCQHKAPHRNWAPAPRHLGLFKDVTIPEPKSLFDDYAGRSSTLKEQQMTIAKDFHWGHDMKFHGKTEFPEHFLGGTGNTMGFAKAIASRI